MRVRLQQLISVQLYEIVCCVGKDAFHALPILSHHQPEEPHFRTRHLDQDAWQYETLSRWDMFNKNVPGEVIGMQSDQAAYYNALDKL